MPTIHAGDDDFTRRCFMASDVSEKMKPVMDFYARWSKDSFDMISKAMAMYNKMSATWVDVAEGSSKEKTDDPLKKWGEAFGGAYNELFEMYTNPLKMFGTSPAPGKEAWENAFAGWQKMFSATPAGSAPPADAADFMDFSKSWFEGYSKICQSWIASMQKMGEVCKSSMGEGQKPESAMNVCTEISDRFLNEWSTFVSEQGKSFLALWRSRLPLEKEPKKGKKE
jgi:hypothetical protein